MKLFFHIVQYNKIKNYFFTLKRKGVPFLLAIWNSSALHPLVKIVGLSMLYGYGQVVFPFGLTINLFVMRRTTSLTIVCEGTGVSKTYRIITGEPISTEMLRPLYYNRLRTLGYKRDQLMSQSAEHLMQMYERHKEWVRKGIVSPQLQAQLS